MDLIILILLIGIVIFFFRRFSSFIYFLAIVDIFFRIVYVINQNIIKKISVQLCVIINRLPASIPDLLGRYSSGLLYDLLFWLYVIAYIIFLFYIIRTFFRKK